MDDLRQDNRQLKQEYQELRVRLTAAEVKIKQLVKLLVQNSRNSNWPSNRDKSRPKRKIKSPRPKTGYECVGSIRFYN